MDLRRELCRVVEPDRVLTRSIDRIAHANDASVYRLVPRAVVLPRTVAEVRELLETSRRLRLPLTFRAAGTSLSGQAITDGILVVLSRHWRGVDVLDAGRRVRVEPGIVGGLVNRHLGRFGAKIGPDPASIDACMMGGILANNSSGMCCGVERNAYHTLDSMHFVLPDGLSIDSAAQDADERLRREAPELVEGLLGLQRRIENDADLTARIRAKYRMKNTTGYSLNALLDFESPVEILAHLMIGSEGTLGFIAGAVLRTIPDDPEKYTGLLLFEDVPAACSTIAALRDSGARALELMDRRSLRSIEAEPGMPARIRDLPPDAAALLVEYQCASPAALEERIAACERLLPELPLLGGPEFTRDPAGQAALWRVRKGLIPSVGAMRARGTSFIIEDVVFPVERLARGVAELQALFVEYGYDDAIVFGHAKDGNLHFVLTQSFERNTDVERYDGFMRALADLVATRHGGALKAEHGTGRNMAPFVAHEWGEAAYAIMTELKALIDPDGLLNPGVVINTDPNAHVRDLKALPTVEREVDACIECGFCERHCPSRDLTLTPRQRIVVRREMARLRETDPGSTCLAELERDYGYAALDTCATDGMCALACPVSIDTGALVKRLRGERHSETSQELATILASRFGLVERATRTALRLVHAIRGAGGSSALERLAHACGAVSEAALPGWSRDLPRAARARVSRPATSRGEAAAVYFPSCVSRVLAPADSARDEVPLSETVLAVAARGGSPLWIPEDVEGLCCGMPFASKGYARAARSAGAALLERMVRWADGGSRPIVVDSSPCAMSLKQLVAALPRSHPGRGVRVLDSIEFAHDSVVPGLPAPRREERVLLHPPCSVHRMDLVERLTTVASACARTVEIPIGGGCCGFAGDRGFSHPELTRAALEAASTEISARGFDGHYSSSPTCEIGLARITNRPYRSFWHLLDRSTRRTGPESR